MHGREPVVYLRLGYVRAGRVAIVPGRNGGQTGVRIHARTSFATWLPSLLTLQKGKVCGLGLPAARRVIESM
jgi:hypothetical protein